MRLTSLIILILQVSFHLQGQELAPSFQYQSNINHHLTKKQLDKFTDHNVPYALYQKAHELGKPALLFPGKKPRLVVNCSYSVYTLQNDSVVNLYSRDNKGFTCSAFPYLLNDTLYFLGGYGFWQGHSALTYFNPERKEWSLRSVAKTPTNYKPGVTFEKDGHIYSILGETINTISGKEVKLDPHGYRLDPRQESWERISVEWGEEGSYFPMSNYPIAQYSLENYQVYLTLRPNFKKKAVAIHKPSLKIYVLDDPPRDPELIYTEGDTLHYYNETGLHTIVFDRAEMGPAIAAIIPHPPNNALPTYLWIGGAVILILAPLIFRKKIKFKTPLVRPHKPAQEQSPNTPNPKLCKLLRAYDGEAISVLTFDEITGVDQLDNMDSRRSKRAQILREINGYFNDQGAGLTIERRRSPRDKRYFEYKIRYVEHQH